MNCIVLMKNCFYCKINVVFLFVYWPVIIDLIACLYFYEKRSKRSYCYPVLYGIRKFALISIIVMSIFNVLLLSFLLFWFFPDLSGKMFIFPEETDTANVKMELGTQNISTVTVCLRYCYNWGRNLQYDCKSNIKW